VLYSTHNLYEANDIGTDLILIKNGTIALAEKIANIKLRNTGLGLGRRLTFQKLSMRRRETGLLRHERFEPRRGRTDPEDANRTRGTGDGNAQLETRCKSCSKRRNR